MKTIRLLTTEKFAVIHEESEVETDDVILSTDKFAVRAIVLDHGTPCLGFHISEPQKQSLNVDRMKALQLPPGPWAAAVKDPARPDSDVVYVNDATFRLGDLRTELLTVSRGDSLGYLTDFRVDDLKTRRRLVKMFRGTQTLICENNYRDQEQENARNTFHLTSSEVGQLAADINPEALVVFHVSDRYENAQLQEQLDQIRQWFPGAAFPATWGPFI